MKGSRIGCSGGTRPDFRDWRQLRWQCHGKLLDGPRGQGVYSPAPPVVWASALSSDIPSAAPAVPWGEGTEGSAISLRVTSLLLCPSLRDAPTLVSSRASKNRRDQELTAEDRLGPAQSPALHPHQPLSAQGVFSEGLPHLRCPYLTRAPAQPCLFACSLGLGGLALVSTALGPGPCTKCTGLRGPGDANKSK